MAWHKAGILPIPCTVPAFAKVASAAVDSSHEPC